MKSDQPQSKTPWILVLIFFTFAVGIAASGITYYRQQAAEIKEEKHQDLAAIASLKVGQITDWLQEREGDALMIQNSSAIARYFKNYTGTKAQERELTHWLEAVCKHNGYSSVAFYDAQGKVRYTYGADSEIDTSAYKQLRIVMERQSYGMSDLHISNVSKKATIALVIPLILWEQNDHPAVGALFFRIDPYQVLYPLIQSWPTPSRTAETLLVRRDGEEVVFLNELRHQKNTAFRLKFPLTQKNLPASCAARGTEGVMEGVDYRGVPVLAATRKVPHSSWFIVAKADQDEVYLPLRHDLWTVGVSVAVTIMMSGAFLGLWWRHQRSRYYRRQYEAEIERRALLKHFDYLVKYANDIIILCDIAGNITEVNDRACNQYGYTREELLRLNVRDLLPPGLRSEIPALLQKMTKQEGMVFETRHIRKDGTSFPVELSARSFAVEGNNYLQAIGRDITERKQAEQELREREARFREIFEESPLGVATSGTDFHFIRVNEAFCRMFGYTPRELTSLTFKELTHPEHVSADAENIRKLLAGEMPVYQTEKRYVRKDRKVFWGAVKVSAIHDTSGQFEYFLVMIDDITAMKQVEGALSAEKERLSVTLRSIGDGVITTDRQGNVTLLNKVAEELTGWSLAEGLGKPLSEVFPIINEQTRERCENPVEKVLQSGGIVGLANHTALIRRDGTEIVIADSGAPIRDQESAIIGVVLVFRDITDKEKINQALQNAQKLEAVGALAAGIAHDFNNLLGGVFGYLDLAREQAEKGNAAAAAKTLYKGLGAFDRAKHLTRQLLTFSKGGLPIRKTLPLADHVRKAVLFALSGSNISPVFSLPADVWLCDFDENQMAQVFDNIVINARQAMPLGGEIDVAVRNVASGEAPKVLPAKNYVCISIKDYGAGIVKEHLPRIFDPFFTTKQQGNGLGLAVSYAIVKKHDGMIEAESVLGEGTTVRVYLPASSGQVIVMEKRETPVHQGRGRILVMDDEEFVLDVLAQMLTTMGYEVLSARNGDEAVAFTREAEAAGRHFSAAILDLTIPGGRGGKEVVTELLAIVPALKVVASSGYSEDPVMAKPADYGFAGRLVKPYRMDDLARMLESLAMATP